MPTIERTMIDSNLLKIIPELENEIRIRENRNWNSSKSIVLLRSTVRQIKRVIKTDELEKHEQSNVQMTIDFPE